MKTLEEPYRSRAVPPGSPRYWSWWFAAARAREALLGIYALQAEWQAVMDPGTNADVAQTKLAWWRDEAARLVAGTPVHPISRYLAAIPGSFAGDFAPLAQTVEAAAAQVAGAPLERAAELETHAGRLFGNPLEVAAVLSGIRRAPSVRACTTALATAEYLSRAIVDYGREAKAGRIIFAVDELLAAQIDNADLSSAVPPNRLRCYLDRLRQQAAGYFERAALALAPPERPPLRHLLVLARLGLRRQTGLERRDGADFRLADLYNAWSAARRAAAGR